MISMMMGILNYRDGVVLFLWSVLSVVADRKQMKEKWNWVPLCPWG